MRAAAPRALIKVRTQPSRFSRPKTDAACQKDKIVNTNMYLNLEPKCVPNRGLKMVPSFTYIGNAIIGERSDQNTFSKLTPFLVPKNVTSFSVCLRNVVSNLTPFLVTEIGTSCSARTQMWANGSLAKAYRLESLGDCHGDCGMVSMRVQAHIKLPLQQCVSGGLV